MFLKNILLKHYNNKPGELNPEYIDNIKKFCYGYPQMINNINGNMSNGEPVFPWALKVWKERYSEGTDQDGFVLIMFLLNAQVINIPFLRKFAELKEVKQALDFMENNVSNIDFFK